MVNDEEDEIRKVLRIPRDHKLAAIIYPGYTDMKLKVCQRREAETVMRYDQFLSGNGKVDIYP